MRVPEHLVDVVEAPVDPVVERVVEEPRPVTRNEQVVGELGRFDTEAARPGGDAA